MFGLEYPIIEIAMPRYSNFCLDKSDYDTIDAICTKSNNLFDMVGDCGDEYR